VNAVTPYYGRFRRHMHEWGPCRCGYGLHAGAWWYRRPELDDLEEIRDQLQRELKYIEEEIEKLKAKKSE